MNPEGGLEKRRERHFVEISKKRSAMILSKDRSEHGFVDSQTSAFIDRALQFIDDKNFFGLETLTKEFLLANPQPNITVLIERFLQEDFEPKLLMLLTTLNHLCMECQLLEVPQPEQVIFKCLLLESQRVSAEGFKFLAAVLCVDKRTCLVMLESQLFLRVGEEVVRPYLRAHLLTLFQNLCYNLSVVVDMNTMENQLVELMNVLLKLYQQTREHDYLNLLKEQLQEIDNEDIVLMLIQRHMQEVHEVFAMLKEPSKYRKDELQAAAEVLEMMFYCDENVVATLMAADMGSYILPMLESEDVRVQTCALCCLESILISNEAVDYIEDYKYIPELLKMFYQAFDTPDISYPAYQNGLIKCIVCLNDESTADHDQIDWEPFIKNCISRLDNELLQHETLGLLRSIYDTADKEIWLIYDRYGLMKKIYEIAKIGTQEDSRNLAESLLELHYQDTKEG